MKNWVSLTMLIIVWGLVGGVVGYIKGFQAGEKIGIMEGREQLGREIKELLQKEWQPGMKRPFTVKLPHTKSAITFIDHQWRPAREALVLDLDYIPSPPRLR